jgi:NADPH2:quinone reductase
MSNHAGRAVRAVVLEATGGPEQLVVQDLPEPAPGEGQALVDVRAAGVNFADVLIRLGRYPQMPELPAVLGSEIAGEVDGRRVMAFTRGLTGGYAERVAADPRWLLPIPEGASFAEGAAFPLAFLTAWIPLTQLVRVGFGSRVLVTAAAGAVGTAALQLIRALNGRPVAVAGSEEKLELARSLGADEAVTYDGAGELEPVDVVFDLVGGDVFKAALGLLKPLGSAVAVGYAGGLWEDVSPAWLVGRNIGVHGFYLGRLTALRPDLVEQAASDILRLWEGGIVRPIVGHELPLEQAGEAHRLIEERKTTGKVVLIP